MKVILKKDFTEKQRNIAIRTAWKSMATELYSICQTSKNIDEVIKSKLTQPVCGEYTRQQIVTFLSNFSSGEFDLNFNENNAIELANIIADLSSEEYNMVLEQAKKEEEIFNKSIQEQADQISKNFDKGLADCKKFNEDLGERIFDN